MWLNLKIIKIFLIQFLLFTSCEVIGPNQEKLPAIDNGYMIGDIQGDKWSAEYISALFVTFDQDTLISIEVHSFDSLLFPYNEGFVFSYFYDPKINLYSTQRKTDIHERRTGGFYMENDGDVVLSRYYPIADSLDKFTLTVSKDSIGARYAEGIFEMTVVVDPAYDRDIDQDRRRRPDTVRITNGYYRVELEKRND